MESAATWEAVAGVKASVSLSAVPEAGELPLSAGPSSEPPFEPASETSSSSSW